MDLPSEAACSRYYGMTAITTLMATGFVIDSLYWHPGAHSLTQKISGIVLLLVSFFTQTTLRTQYTYCRKMKKNGCELMPIPPKSDLYGIVFSLDLARAVRNHAMLELRQRQLLEIGHTFVSRIFPEAGMTIITDDPQNIKAVLATKFDDWDTPSTRVTSFLPVLGTHSIFVVDGPEWQHSRAMLRPSFVRDQLSDLAVYDRHISDLIQRIPKDGSRFDLQALFSLFTIDAITDFMFGHSTAFLKSAPADAVKFGTAFDIAMSKTASRARLGWLTQILPDAELNDASRFIRQYVNKFIERIKRDEKSSLWEDSKKYVFLNELIKSGEPEEVIRDQLISMFVAGRDTTMSVLTKLFFELSRRPDVVATIRKEIEDLGEANPSWEQLRSMKYLNWAVKEALRLGPPVPNNAREAVRDTVLPRGGGRDGQSPVFVPKGTQVRYQVWVMQRRRDLYGDDAEEFRPERWADLKVTYEYIPFNAGPRICIGQQFALTEMAMVTFRLLQAFKEIRREDDRPPLMKLGVNPSLLYGCWVSMTPA